MSDAAPALNPAVDVVCLCAAWCGTCREYADAFARLAREQPQARFHWVDVEDDADLVDELDVENFPTALIGVGGAPVFFGVLLPHIQTLERLVQDAADLRPLADNAETRALRQLLAALAQREP